MVPSSDSKYDYFPTTGIEGIEVGLNMNSPKAISGRFFV